MVAPRGISSEDTLNSIWMFAERRLASTTISTPFLLRADHHLGIAISRQMTRPSAWSWTSSKTMASALDRPHGMCGETKMADAIKMVAMDSITLMTVVNSTCELSSVRMARWRSTGMANSSMSMGVQAGMKRPRSNKTWRALGLQLHPHSGQVGCPMMGRAVGAMKTVHLSLSPMSLSMRHKESNLGQLHQHATSHPHRLLRPQSLHRHHHLQVSAHCNLVLIAEAMLSLLFLLGHPKIAARNAKMIQHVAHLHTRSMMPVEIQILCVTSRLLVVLVAIATSALPVPLAG